MAANEDIHRLLDLLPERELHVAKRFLEFLRDSSSHVSDPVLRAFLEAPIDDEPLAELDVEAIRRGREEAARGDLVSFDEAFGSPRRAG